MQIKDNKVYISQHRLGWASVGSIEAVHGNVVPGIDEILSLDHVVLLVPAGPVLRAKHAVREGAGCSKRVQAVDQFRRDRGRVGDKRETVPFQGLKTVPTG